MLSAPLADNETHRLAALASYHVLDTDSEPGFDDLARLAAHICATPIALVSLIDSHRQWFKSHYGLTATETPRALAFCAHTILGERVLVVPDSLLDIRFCDNPLVSNSPYVRSYAGAPLIDADGYVLGSLCVIDHVPRSLTAEQLDLLQLLAGQVVSQLELRRSRDQARSADKIKSTFLSGISHEIRTPLNGVLGMSQLLNESNLSAEQRDQNAVIMQSGENLLTVVNNLLEYSQLEAGGVQLKSASFDLHDLVSNALRANSSNASAKALSQKLDWRSSLSPKRLGDAQRLRQILLNLLDNAVKFSQVGRITVKVTDEVNSSAVRISVADCGIGIAASMIPNLFNGFMRADASTTRAHAGTGLGLAITRHLVELMGGRIGVTSEVGQGSCFWVSLPLAIDEQPVQRSA